MEGALHGFDLLGALLFAHLGNGEHQVDRLVVVQGGGLDAEQVGEEQLCFAAIGGQIVDLSAEGDGAAQPCGQIGERDGGRHADLGTHVAERGLGTGPDDVLDGEGITVEGLFARIGIDQADDRGDVQPEVVAERRVLTEIVGVVGIIVRSEAVAGQQDDALSDLGAQLATARGIGLCGKHSA